MWVLSYRLHDRQAVGSGLVQVMDRHSGGLDYSWISTELVRRHDKHLGRNINDEVMHPTVKRNLHLWPG